MAKAMTSEASIEAARKKFEEQFAKEMGADEVLDRSGEISPYEVIPTGSLELDYKLGVGGWVEGRVHEIHGPEHVGKTTLCMHGVANAQKKHPNKMVGWVDMEQTFDKSWAQKNGVDLKRLWIYTPKDAESTADAVKRLVGSGLCSMVVLDSVGGMISRLEREKNADQAAVALVAKIVTRMVLEMSPTGNANGTAMIVVNQVRSNIDGNKYAPKTSNPGGWALKHITTIKLRVRTSGGSDGVRNVKVDGEDVPVSQQIAIHVEKNKTAPKGRVANIWLTNQNTDKWGPIGIDKADEAFEFGKRLGLITGKGWYVLPDGEKLQGGDAVRNYLRERPAMIEEIRQAVLDTAKGSLTVESEVIPIDETAEDNFDPNTGEIAPEGFGFSEPPSE